MISVIQAAVFLDNGDPQVKNYLVHVVLILGEVHHEILKDNREIYYLDRTYLLLSRPDLLLEMSEIHSTRLESSKCKKQGSG
jgi:hypothetical protein